MNSRNYQIEKAREKLEAKRNSQADPDGAELIDDTWDDDWNFKFSGSQDCL